MQPLLDICYGTINMRSSYNCSCNVFVFILCVCCIVIETAIYLPSAKYVALGLSYQGIPLWHHTSLPCQNSRHTIRKSFLIHMEFIMDFISLISFSSWSWRIWMKRYSDITYEHRRSHTLWTQLFIGVTVGVPKELRDRHVNGWYRQDCNNSLTWTRSRPGFISWWR